MNVARTAFRARARAPNNNNQPPSKQPRYSFDGLITTSSKNTGLQTTSVSLTTPYNSSSSNKKSNSRNSSSNNKNNYPGTSSTSFQNNSSGRNTTPKFQKVISGLGSSSSGNKNQSRMTPGSSTSNNTMPNTCNIIAITEGRGAAKCEVGMAVIDLRRPQLILCQISDTHSYIHSLTRLHYFNPTEIIVPHTFNSGFIATELYKLITDQFTKVQITSVRRRCFSDTEGLQIIKELCAPEYKNCQLQLIHKFYALTAAAALLKYVEQIQCVLFASQSLKIEYYGSQDSTLIDVDTAIRLELVESLSGISDRRSCLLSILNYTHTTGGLRNLRANILQPPCNEQIIETRLHCIEELLGNNESLMPSLQRIIRQFVDVDKILWLCMSLPVQEGNKAGEAQLNYTLLLKTTLDILPNLISTLDLAKGNWFQKVKRDLEDPKFLEIKDRIKEVLQDDAHIIRGAGSHLQRCFAVRPNINGLLDVARRLYSELITDIQDKVNQLAETYQLPLRLNSNVTRGFHIVLSLGAKNKSQFNVKNLPSVFVEVQNHGNTVTMTTEDIIILDQQAKESLNEIQTMSNIVISGLLQDLRSYMTILYKLCDHIAELDMILSLAQVSSAGNYVRPMFDEYIELKNSIHPILDCVLPTSPVPNDVFASPEFNFHIITGPNMGGKSIFIKQIAILQIMAQIGCFVPATKAVFRISDHIFSRIGFNDSIECNASSYVLEMREIQYILQTLTPRSLIIVDELCRGTSNNEGTSMAWAICEKLLDTQAFTFFTTHFLYLTKLQDLYFNVTNLHTNTLITNDTNELIYKYKVVPGITNIENYGLMLAKSTNLPETVINLAEDLITVIKKHVKALPLSEHKKIDDFVLYEFMANLKQEARQNNLTEKNINDFLTKFNIEHPQLCNKLDTEKIYSLTTKISNSKRTKANYDKTVESTSTNIVINNISPNITENIDEFKIPESRFKSISNTSKPKQSNTKSTSNSSNSYIPNSSENNNNNLKSSNITENYIESDSPCNCDSEMLTYDPYTRVLNFNDNSECPLHDISVISTARRGNYKSSDVVSDIDHLKLKDHLDAMLKAPLKSHMDLKSSSSLPIMKNSHFGERSTEIILCEPDILQESFDSNDRISSKSYSNLSDSSET